jgi:hypothetical protein
MLKYGLPLTREHYTAIGQVAAVWQALEITIQVAIWAMLGLNGAEGRLSTAALRFDTLLDMISILAVKEVPSEATLLQNLVSEAKLLQGKRNTVVHGLWGFGESPIALRAQRFRMKDAADPPTFTPEQITMIADQINGTREQWWVYIDNLIARDALMQKPAG